MRLDCSKKKQFEINQNQITFWNVLYIHSQLIFGIINFYTF